MRNSAGFLFLWDSLGDDEKEKRPVIYAKPALTFEAQADLLAANRDELIARLKAVNYYRLSGYLYPFRDLPNDTFRPGADLDTVWRRYNFDRRLRLILLDAIERIEVAVRTRLV